MHAGALEQINQALPEKTWLSGWEILGPSIFGVVRDRFWLVVGPILLLVVLSLVAAFRRFTEVILSAISISLSGLVLLAFMSLAGWSWNLMSLMAVPLILGTGVDYSIFMQMALRRHQGNSALVRKSTSRALLLCAMTAMAGFGSLAFSSNAGMASLGGVCAVGIACNVLVAVVLLPAWWRLSGGASRHSDSPAHPAGPSRLYAAGVWKVGLLFARVLPPKIARHLGSWAALAYFLLCPTRRAVVVDNLLPVLSNDLPAARRTATRLFSRFGSKIADLLRFEAGRSVDDVLGNAFGYEQLEKAKTGGRGVLLLTLHLGNWELGSCWLMRRGIEFKVITQVEPGAHFTTLRQEARARYKIETIVVGNDSFAFLNVIRSLESGSVIALLVDRPPPPTGIQVRLFGKPFVTSIAAAELARATGCALIPCYVIWNANNARYEAYLLPEIPYDRASLRNAENRAALCQEMMSRLEPIVSRHPDQWFHFVPLWSEAKPKPRFGS